MKELINNWQSIYIFHRGNADEILIRFIYPYIQQWAKPWFFIHYWEGGDHIRLRLKSELHQCYPIINVLSEQYPEILSIKIAKYEPEIDRYGNHDTINWAERYFQCSSAYILEWVANRDERYSTTAQAIKMHLALLYVLKWKYKKLMEVCNMFLEGWLPRLFDRNMPKEEQRIFWLNKFASVFGASKCQLISAAEQYWRKLESGEVGLDMKDYFMITKEVTDLYQSVKFPKEKLHQIFSSFIHMNNNRLGISNYEEAYIMYAIKECLGFIHENSNINAEYVFHKRD